MSRFLPLILLAGATCAGCSAEPEPTPAPGQVERLLVRLDAQQTDAAERLLRGKAREKLHKAERLVAPLEKVQADKIDPSVAAALIGG